MLVHLQIDDEYSYEYRDDTVIIRQNGNFLIAGPNASGAWVAAAHAIDELQEELRAITQESLELSLRLEAAEHVLGNLGREWDEEYEDYV